MRLYGVILLRKAVRITVMSAHILMHQGLNAHYMIKYPRPGALL